MSYNRRPRIALAQSESLEDEDNEVPPPPTYNEAMTMGYVTSIPEPSTSANRTEDDDVLGELLNRVKEQGEDLKAELGMKSKDSDDEPGTVKGAGAVGPADILLSLPESSTHDSDISEDPVKDNKRNEEAEIENEGAKEDNMDEESEGAVMIPAIVLHDIEADSPDEDEPESEKQKKFHKHISQQREKGGKHNTEELEMISIHTDESEPGVNALDPRVRRLSLDIEDDRYSPRNSTFEQFEVDDVDTEAATAPRRQARNRRDSDYDCGPTPVPFLREIVNFGVKQYHSVKVNWPHWSTKKRLILVFSVLFVIGLVLLVSLLPASFVYVDYDKMGFSHNRATAMTNYDHVYDYGCYLLAPQHTMVLFPATAQFLDLKLWVFDKAGLTVGLDIYLQYFLRPHELAKMYQKYHDDYHNIVTLTAQSAVKNTAMQFSLEEFRLNRSMVETRLFSTLRYYLSGDCCENYNNSRFPSTNHYHQPCSPSAHCSRGKHVDLGFFQFGALHVPHKVLDRYMRQVVLELETERENYIQEKAIEEKLTTLSVQKILNEAKEIKRAAEAKSHVIIANAKAAKLRDYELSYVTSLKKVYSFLNITKEDPKMSLLYLNTLKDKKDNLVAFSYNYDQETVFSP